MLVMREPDHATRFTVRLPPAQRAELERVARAHERTASQQVRHYLTVALEAERHLAGPEPAR